ncbi:hypothetical protein BABINDRAFT_10267 [Babjeviella inositovora NRRL Y-12698]|uniref:Uncharacterized protein n=1 Tax=Babjeviella inositovora NRRL Y-12698 TaxID=984486 RepID=A0A1E3QI45_9ASCO|nr:uncharacterized protein BABINDRAFT_10267 [Babjeviella inositovora NRRL Y-12698]ODQ77371.1 hypothetical protein BABINDRAFT_10267 [Babjeviella inositovora NRRL Y-12698]
MTICQQPKRLIVYTSGSEDKTRRLSLVLPPQNRLAGLSALPSDYTTWRPQAGSKSCSKDEASGESSSRRTSIDDLPTSSAVNKSNTYFHNYMFTPTLYGSTEIPAVFGHVTDNINDEIYLFGGMVLAAPGLRPVPVCVRLVDEQYRALTEFPRPLNADALANPHLVPTSALYTITTVSKRVTRVVIDTDRASLRGNALRGGGDTLPALLFHNSAVVNERHIFYYGGFTMEVDQREEAEGIVEYRVLRVNTTRAWILDVVTHRVKEVRVAASSRGGWIGNTLMSSYVNETATSLVAFVHKARTTGRDGSSTVAGVTLNHDGEVLTFYSFGGYRLEAGKFVASNAVVAIELEVLYKGAKSFMRFGETVLCATIAVAPDATGRASQPEPRGFAGDALIDSTYMFSRADHEARYARGIIAGDTANVSRTLFEGKALLVHGGTQGTRFHGDMWAFDFLLTRWKRIDTYVHKYDFSGGNYAIRPHEREPAQLSSACHLMHLLGRYLVFSVGVFHLEPSGVRGTPRERYLATKATRTAPREFLELVMSLPEVGAESTGVDISQVAFKRSTLFDLTTQTYMATKYIRDVPSLYDLPRSMKNRYLYLGYVGSTSVYSKSRIFIIGGQAVPQFAFTRNSGEEEDENPYDQMNLLYMLAGILEIDMPVTTAVVQKALYF